MSALFTIENLPELPGDIQGKPYVDTFSAAPFIGPTFAEQASSGADRPLLMIQSTFWVAVGVVVFLFGVIRAWGWIVLTLGHAFPKGFNIL